MYISIRSKLILCFGIILILFSLVVFINHSSISINNGSINHVRNVVVEEVKYSSILKTSAIEVQQYLTDASLTKSQDSLKEAQNSNEQFKNTVRKLIELDKSLSNKLNGIDQEFDTYYSLGQKMTDTYINEGNEKGNEMMKQFDPAASSIIDEVNEFDIQINQLMDNDMNSIYSQMNLSERTGMIAGGIALLGIIFMVILLSRQITIPLNSLLSILTDIESGHGDLTMRINIKSSDEIGRIAQKFNSFIDNIEHIISNIRTNSSIVSKGSELLNETNVKTSDAIEQIKVHMNKVSSDTENISKSIDEISVGISQIASSSQSTASDAQNISCTSEEINIIVKNSGKVALDAKLEMDSTEKISYDSILISNELGQKAQEIGNIIDTIKDITDRTNLLALNASIEAARAGEQGRGFGVVAEEIRKLADSNSQSADNIENLIKSIQKLITQTIAATNKVGINVKQGKRMVEDIYSQLGNIITSISGINERIQNIASCTQEQSASTEELAATIDTIDKSNLKIVSMIAEIATGISTQAEIIKSHKSNAADLNNSAEHLLMLVNKFKIR